MPSSIQTKVAPMEKIDHRQMLSVFEKIVSNGQREDDGAVLNGVHASSSFDGYSITLWDNHVSATLQFHNAIHCDCDNQPYLDEFLEKLAAIDRNYG